ncbi:MAG: hypothetical protein JWO79_3525 [Actinomycetia bacterium]|nr:hypothetical protein [Actinomycetes bacterium]
MALDMLQPVEGNGVLARFGGLTLLCDGDARFERQIGTLIDLVTEIARTGGDGRRLGRKLAALLLAADDDGAEYPALCLVGPLGNGLAVLVHGAAVADVRTGGQTIHLDGGEAVTWVDRRFPDPVEQLRAALGRGFAGGQPDRWSRLDSGVIRAGGLLLGAAAESGRGGPRAPIPEQAPRGDSEDLRPSYGGSPAFEGASPFDRAPTLDRSQPLDRAQSFDRANGEREATSAERASSLGRVVGAADSMHASERVAANFGRGGYESSRIGAAAAGLASVGLAGPSLASSPLADEDTDGVNGSEIHDAELIDDSDGSPFGRRLTLLRHPDETGETVVVGTYCEDRHFNPLSATECMVCDAHMPQPPNATETGPRPPLGVLSLDDGPELTVTGDYIVGRDPATDSDVQAGRARPFPITQTDGHLADVHARVALDGWTVRLVDLGTPGGTHVCPPGGSEWSRVMPQVPTPIRPGSKLLFGRTCVRFDPHRR